MSKALHWKPYGGRVTACGLYARPGKGSKSTIQSTFDHRDVEADPNGCRQCQMTMTFKRAKRNYRDVDNL